MGYTLDTEAARQANSGGRIAESGKYVGMFTKAKKVSSTQGTQGIELTFESNSGQTADYLTMWTINKEGKQIYGFKQLMALMTCLKLRNIDSTPGTVEEYDRDSNQVVKKQAEIYPDLMNKPVGILLQMEEYEKKDHSIGERAVFAGFFDASTELVAAEILDKVATGSALEKMVAQLNPVKKLRSSTGASQAPASSNLAGIDDDIPF